MKFTSYLITAILASSKALSFAAASDEVATKEAKMNYTIDVVAQNYTDSDGVLLQGFLSTPPSNDKGKLIPAVVILHDSSGADKYEKQRSTMIAKELGYVGFAADIFGVETEIPADNGGWGGPFADFIDSFRNNATLFTQRIAAAVDYVQKLPMVDETKVAIMGYCLGGTGVLHYLNVAGEKDGGASAAVSIHPTLFGAWEKPIGKINIPSVFLTGGDDFLTGPQAMASLEEDMGNASTVEWETNRYAKIGHAFTNWYSENYNQRADERSWESMKTFLSDQFGHFDDTNTWESASQLDVVDVLDEGVFAFEGLYLSLADDEGGSKGWLAPLQNLIELFDRNETVADADKSQMMAFITFPLSWALDRDICGTDWELCNVPTVIIQSDGPGGMAKQRAIQITKRYGYAAFVVEDYKSLTSELIQQVIPFVDLDKVALEVYGGEAPTAGDLGNDGLFKVVSSFHSGLSQIDESAPTNNPQVLVFSGVDGDNISDIITLENSLIATDVDYELNRYSDSRGNFTNWNGPDYNPYAARRSFEAVESVYREMLGEVSVVYIPSIDSTGFAPFGDGNAAGLPSIAAASLCVLLAVACNILF